MKSAVHHSNRAINKTIAAIRPKFLNSRRELSKESLVYWLAVEIPDSCFYTHSDPSLAPFPDTVNRLNISPFIYCPPTHLHPGVCFKGQFLRADNHFSRDTITPQ